MFFAINHIVLNARCGFCLGLRIIYMRICYCNMRYGRKKAPYIGGQQFVKELVIKHLEMIERKTPVVGRQSVGLEVLLNRLSKEYGISVESILRGGRAGKSVRCVNSSFGRQLAQDTQSPLLPVFFNAVEDMPQG